jgi:hypothetical protein
MTTKSNKRSLTDISSDIIGIDLIKNRSDKNKNLFKSDIGPLQRDLMKNLIKELRILKIENYENNTHNMFVQNFEYYSPNNALKSHSLGDKRLADLQSKLEIFDTGKIFGWVRSDDQKLFHDDFIMASIKVIYQDEYAQREQDIIRTMGWDSAPKQEVCIACPRRWGKSVALIMYIVAFLLSQQNVKVTIFSPSARQSEMVSEQVKKALIAVLGSTERLLKQTLERITISGDGADDERMLFAYPSNPDKIRGVSSDLVIVDEMAYVTDELIFDVILPLLQLGDTPLLGVSTMKDDESLYSQILNMKDETGDPIFKTRIFRLSCDACMEKGDPVNCTHMKVSRPEWQDSARIKRLAALYKNKEDLLGQGE